MVKMSFFQRLNRQHFIVIILDNNNNTNSNNALILPFLEAAQNQMIPPPPSPRELFPAIPPYSSSGFTGDTAYTD